MLEGWLADDYVVLFDAEDCMQVTTRYGLDAHISGYQIVGLKGWDNFILSNKKGELFTIPTVPIDSRYLAPLGFAIEPQRIRVDERYRGKIKWYVKPLVFGGDPRASDNIAWITLDQHVEAVKWFNQLYRMMAAK